MSNEIRESLVKKLNPARFSNMSSKMAAIVGFFIGEEFTEPHFVEMVVTSDGYALARLQGDIGCNEFLGAFSDLKRNMDNLIEVAELTEEETTWLREQMQKIL